VQLFFAFDCFFFFAGRGALGRIGVNVDRDIGSERARRNEQREQRRGEFDWRSHSEFVPLDVGGSSVSPVFALTTRTLNSRPRASMRFCSDESSSALRLLPECESSSS